MTPRQIETADIGTESADTATAADVEIENGVSESSSGRPGQLSRLAPQKKDNRQSTTSMSMFWSADLHTATTTSAETGSKTNAADETDMNGDKKDSNDSNSPDSSSSSSSCIARCCRTWWKIYNQYEFLILVVCAILLAKAYPPLGATYLAPQITATWIAVIFIFILAGLGLKTEEFSKAFLEWKFNLVVQLYNFGVDSAVVFGVSRLLLRANALSRPLADGMVVAASLSMTINMVLVLTKSSGGNEASAIFNAAAGNMLGVFLTPVLVLGYVGLSGDGGNNIGEVFYKLAIRVVLPLAFGQLLRKFVPSTVKFYMKHKQRFKKAQQLALVFLVYTVFCRTFSQDNDIRGQDIVIMIAVEFLCLVVLMIGAWYMLRILFGSRPDLRVMGLYGCTHKTVAMGVPLINALYDGDDAVIGLVTLPLLIWHTMQLIIGSFLSPKLAAWVESENERLGISNDDDDDDSGGKDHKNKSDCKDHDNDNSGDSQAGSEKKIVSNRESTATALSTTEHGDGINGQSSNITPSSTPLQDDEVMPEKNIQGGVEVEEV